MPTHEQILFRLRKNVSQVPLRHVRDAYEFNDEVELVLLVDPEYDLAEVAAELFTTDQDTRTRLFKEMLGVKFKSVVSQPIELSPDRWDDHIGFFDIDKTKKFNALFLPPTCIIQMTQ